MDEKSFPDRAAAGRFFHNLSVDADLNYGDIINYILALNQSVHIVISPKRGNGSDPIRFHIEAIKHELDRLVKISDDDSPIGDRVETFAIDTARNVVGMMEAGL